MARKKRGKDLFMICVENLFLLGVLWWALGPFDTNIGSEGEDIVQMICQSVTKISLFINFTSNKKLIKVRVRIVFKLYSAVNLTKTTIRNPN